MVKDKSRCKDCGHDEHETKGYCSNCNCGESSRVYTGTWLGYNPEAMYQGTGDFNTYDRTETIYDKN